MNRQVEPTLRAWLIGDRSARQGAGGLAPRFFFVEVDATRIDVFRRQRGRGSVTSGDQLALACS